MSNEPRLVDSRDDASLWYITHPFRSGLIFPVIVMNSDIYGYNIGDELILLDWENAGDLPTSVWDAPDFDWISVEAYAIYCDLKDHPDDDILWHFQKVHEVSCGAFDREAETGEWDNNALVCLCETIAGDPELQKAIDL